MSPHTVDELVDASVQYVSDGVVVILESVEQLLQRLRRVVVSRVLEQTLGFTANLFERFFHGDGCFLGQLAAGFEIPVVFGELLCFFWSAYGPVQSPILSLSLSLSHTHTHTRGETYLA